MTEFKPGDKVNDTTTYTVMATMGLPDGSQILSLREPVANHSSAYRIVEPSVPVSKIREVCEGLMHKHITNDHDAGWNLAIEVLRDHLTGE